MTRLNYNKVKWYAVLKLAKTTISILESDEEDSSKEINKFLINIHSIKLLKYLVSDFEKNNFV